MRLWRISNYADLSGLGGYRFAARWHNKGRPILYAAEHPAGALAEFLAHLNLEDLPSHFQLLTIEVDDGVAPRQISHQSLPHGWPANHAITRAIGDRWLRESESLLLRVPSALVPDAYNMLINPAHPDAGAMSVIKSEKVPLDDRFRRV